MENLEHPISDSMSLKPDPSKYCCVHKDIAVEARSQTLSSSFNNQIISSSDLKGAELSTTGGSLKLKINVCSGIYNNRGWCMSSKFDRTYFPSHLSNPGADTWVSYSPRPTLTIDQACKFSLQQNVVYTATYATCIEFMPCRLRRLHRRNFYLRIFMLLTHMYSNFRRHMQSERSLLRVVFADARSDISRLFTLQLIVARKRPFFASL